MPAHAAVAGAAGSAVVLGICGVAMPFLVLVAGATSSTSLDGMALCAGGGTAQTIGSTQLDAEQLGNAHTITVTTAVRQLPAYAAVVAVAVAYTESKLHNSTVQTDHDSEGLFQQRISIYTKAVADDPVKATDAFLNRLIEIPEWQSLSVGAAAQTVQISQFPERYQPNAALAEQVVGLYWPSVSAGTNPVSGLDSTSAPTVCAGGGGAGKPEGPTGNNVAGTTIIPVGFVLTGSPQAQIAVRFALAQLGEPYVFAAAGPDAWDCSGLTMAAWAAAGVPLPHWTVTQASVGTPGPTNLSQAVGGDLVLIPGSDGTPQAPGHVGMIAGYVETDGGRRLILIQAPMTGIPVELTYASEWAGQVVAARHVG